MESPGDTPSLPILAQPQNQSQLRSLHHTGFLAAITHHIPDKGAQTVRYYGWYSNKTRGQGHRAKISPDAIKAPFKHRWPGNDRELENRVKRADIHGRRQTGHPRRLGREGGERAMIEQVLAKHAGKINPAAEELGINRPTMN